MTVRDAMSTKLITLGENESVLSGLKLLVKEGVGGAPVVSKDLRILGMVTEFDLLRGIDYVGEAMPVSRVMSHDVVSIEPDADLEEARKLVLTRNWRRLPVVEGGKWSACCLAATYFVSGLDFSAAGSDRSFRQEAGAVTKLCRYAARKLRKDWSDGLPRAVVFVCLGFLTLGSHPGYGQSGRVEVSSPVFQNIAFGGHTLLVNPRYVDSEINGGIRIFNRVDFNGFFGVVPTTFGHGGSHYGELKATLRLFRWGAISVGPASERVTTSNARDRTKIGISGKVGVRRANFDWEIFPYSTRSPGNVGLWFSVPLFGPWKTDGFWDYMRSGTSVGKLNLHYQLSPRLDLMAEYFHNGFLKGVDQDRIGVGIGYKLR
jgi:CBS domain-containing protein